MKKVLQTALIATVCGALVRILSCLISGEPVLWQEPVYYAIAFGVIFGIAKFIELKRAEKKAEKKD